MGYRMLPSEREIMEMHVRSTALEIYIWILSGEIYFHALQAVDYRCIRYMAQAYQIGRSCWLHNRSVNSIQGALCSSSEWAATLYRLWGHCAFADRTQPPQDIGSGRRKKTPTPTSEREMGVSQLAFRFWQLDTFWTVILLKYVLTSSKFTIWYQDLILISANFRKCMRIFNPRLTLLVNSWSSQMAIRGAEADKACSPGSVLYRAWRAR